MVVTAMPEPRSMSRLPSTSSTMPPPARARRPASCCRYRATPRRPCGRSGPATADRGWRWRGSGSARGCSRLSPLARVRNTGCRVRVEPSRGCRVRVRKLQPQPPVRHGLHGQVPPFPAVSVAEAGRGAPRRRQRRGSATSHRNGTLVNYEGVLTCRSGCPTARSTRRTVAAMDLVVFLPLLIIMGAFMFFASRRQKKAMQATIDLHNSLKTGGPRAHHLGPAGHHRGHHRRQRRPGDRARRGHHLDEAGRPRPHRRRHDIDDDDDDAYEAASSTTEMPRSPTRRRPTDQGLTAENSSASTYPLRC